MDADLVLRAFMPRACAKNDEEVKAINQSTSIRDAHSWRDAQSPPAAVGGVGVPGGTPAVASVFLNKSPDLRCSLHPTLTPCQESKSP